MNNEHYNNGPEGMPRVKRMSDSTIDAVIRGENGYGNGAAGNLRVLAHAVAEEVLARVSWPERATPAAASAGAAGTIDTPTLAVWEGQLPESNGKTNYTAVLHRAGAEGFDRFEGMTIAQSEYPDRVRYEADCVRHLIGELAEKPCITDYDADKHSGYVERAATAPVSAAPDAWITPQVAQNLDRQYRDGFLAGWSASEAGDERTLVAVQSRVGKIADYQEGAPVSAAEPDQELLNLAGEALAASDARKGDPEAARRAAEAFFADGQELPAPSDDIAQVREALGLCEPEDAAAFERILLAMRQPQGDLLAKIEALLRGIDADEVSRPDGWWETSYGVAFGTDVLAKIRALFAAKRAAAIDSNNTPED